VSAGSHENRSIENKTPGGLSDWPEMAPAKFDGDRFRTQLKLSKFRIENLAKQLKNASSNRRREIAGLLNQGLEDRARVNVSPLVRLF